MMSTTSIEGAGQLFAWVAWFTGSKNAMKGFGFFLGGLLLEALGFRASSASNDSVAFFDAGGIVLALFGRQWLAMFRGRMRSKTPPPHQN